MSARFLVVAAGVAIASTWMLACEEEPSPKLARLEIQPYLVTSSGWAGIPAQYLLVRDLDKDVSYPIYSVRGFEFRWGEYADITVAVIPPPANVADALNTYRTVLWHDRYPIESSLEFQTCLVGCALQHELGSPTFQVLDRSRSFTATLGGFESLVDSIITHGLAARATFRLQPPNEHQLPDLIGLDISDPRQSETFCHFRCD